MNREIFEKSFLDSLDKNFPEFSKYFNFKLEVFNELDTVIFEINKCLILEFHRAAITLTNNLLERLLKLALINNDTGIGPKPIEEWNSIYEGPNRKYSTIDLANSIELCKKHDLITEKEKILLFGIIRELMRNGFSHADPTKILANLPDDSKMIQGNFKTSEIKEVSLNQKIIPFLQALHMENFAKENAQDYYDFVFGLIFRIEKRLIDRQK